MLRLTLLGSWCDFFSDNFLQCASQLVGVFDGQQLAVTFCRDVRQLRFLFRLNAETDDVNPKFNSKLRGELCRDSGWIAVTTFRAVSDQDDAAPALGLLQLLAGFDERRSDRRHASGVVIVDPHFEIRFVDRAKRLHHIDVLAAACFRCSVNDQRNVEVAW